MIYVWTGRSSFPTPQKNPTIHPRKMNFSSNYDPTSFKISGTPASRKLISDTLAGRKLISDTSASRKLISENSLK